MLAFRVVGKCPPTAEAFIPYFVAGRNFPARMFFQATGISMFTKRHEAARLARSGRLGTYVAEVHLGDDRIFVALTNEATGHLVVWGVARLLANRVVNCVAEGSG